VREDDSKDCGHSRQDGSAAAEVKSFFDREDHKGFAKYAKKSEIVFANFADSFASFAVKIFSLLLEFVSNSPDI
jgi:hypothetical protein